MIQAAEATERFGLIVWKARTSRSADCSHPYSRFWIRSFFAPVEVRNRLTAPKVVDESGYRVAS